MIKDLVRKSNIKRHHKIKNQQAKLLVKACQENDIKCDNYQEVVDNMKVTPDMIFN